MSAEELSKSVHHDAPSEHAPGPVRNPEDLTTDEVRQGVTGHGVRYVLLISLTASLVGLIAVWAYVS